MTIDIKKNADILDVCCGARMFYDNQSKDRDDTIYMDIRTDVVIEYTHTDTNTKSVWKIEPDVVGDYRNIPFEDNRFALVIFDPPHLIRKNTGIIVQKYGKLGDNWKDDLRKGFTECMRVLRPGGFLNFKWSEYDIPLSEISPLFPCRPMYYQRRRGSFSGYWAMFRKEVVA